MNTSEYEIATKTVVIKNLVFKIEIEVEDNVDERDWYTHVSSKGFHKRMGSLSFYRVNGEESAALLGDCGTTAIKIMRAVIQEGIKMAAKLNLDAVSFLTSDREISRENLYAMLAKKYGGERGLSEWGEFIIPLKEGEKVGYEELCQNLIRCGCGQSEWPERLCKDGEEVSVFMKNGRWRQ